MNNNVRNILFAAHVDAGKTTLAEQILYKTGAVRKIGRVDDGSSYFDSSPIEMERGISVFSELSKVNWGECQINLLDTPGHIDFIAEVERALSVVESVVIIISAIEGIQQQTEMIWELVKEKNVPTIFFINKADREEADIERVYEQILNNLTSNAIYIPQKWQLAEKQNDYADDYALKHTRLSEFLAENDINLLSKYLEEQPITDDELLDALHQQFESNKVFPVLVGSAKTGLGIEDLLDMIVDIVPQFRVYNTDKPLAKVFKIKNSNSEKQTYVKVLAGEFQVRDAIVNTKSETNKISQIRTFLGNRSIPLNLLKAGDIGIFFGLKNMSIGEIIGNEVERDNWLGQDKIKHTRLLQTQVQPVQEIDRAKLHSALNILNEEDPLLEYESEPQSKEMIIHIMGKMHMEIIEAVIFQRFGIEVRLANPLVKYFETIEKTSQGFCHFEPKKHYAEVEVILEPNERGRGNQFLSVVSTDHLPEAYQKAIEKTIPEALNQGILTGSPLTDVKVKLIAGKYHLEHTHGGDFRLATIRAIRQALENNQILLLEPYTEFKITVPPDLVGKVISDISKMKGVSYDPTAEKDFFVLSGELPLSLSMDYPLELTSLSGGKAHMVLKSSRLKPCHNQDQILAELDSDFDASNDYKDRLYNAVSLFRAKRKMKKVVFDQSFDNENNEDV